MSKIEELKQIYLESGLAEIFFVRKEDERTNHSSLRFKTNDFRIRAIEIWDHEDDRYFRIYYSPDAPEDVKTAIAGFGGLFSSKVYASDFRGDFLEVAKSLAEFLGSDRALYAAKSSPRVSKGYGYEGLVLPDVDTSDAEILGRTFGWKEILAIDQDPSENNVLKTALQQSGAYLQRSSDGSARYVGSAYGEGGLIGRWLKHLGSNGNAKHLNFYVLENGYSNMQFCVLEVTSSENALAAESRWKVTLGSVNNGPYDGLRLNCN